MCLLKLSFQASFGFYCASFRKTQDIFIRISCDRALLSKSSNMFRLVPPDSCQFQHAPNLSPYHPTPATSPRQTPPFLRFFYIFFCTSSSCVEPAGKATKCANTCSQHGNSLPEFKCVHCKKKA